MKLAHVCLSATAVALLAACLTGGKSDPETKSWELTAEFGAGVDGYDSSQALRGYQISWGIGGDAAAYWEWPEDGVLKSREQVDNFTADEFLSRCTVVVTGPYVNLCWNNGPADSHAGEFKVDTMGIELYGRFDPELNDSVWGIGLWVGGYPTPEDTTWRCSEQVFSLNYDSPPMLSCKRK